MANKVISKAQKALDAHSKYPYLGGSKQDYYQEISEREGVPAATVKDWFIRGKAWATIADSSHPELKQYCEENGIPVEGVNHYWHKGKQFSVHVKQDHASYFDIRDEVVGLMKDYAPKYPKIKRKAVKDPHLLVVDPADIHLGKLATVFETGDEYTIEIAVKRAISGIKGLIRRSSMYNIDKVLLIAGNDILHTDTPTRRTTGGTPQDTDGMWHTNFIEGKKLYVRIIEMLLTVADVHVLFCPSNHDFMSGFFLCDTVASWFKNNSQVTFDVDMKHRKYFKYHNNLIGATHGDGAKQSDLPSLMAVESADFSTTKKRYIYGHHIHHKVMKDYIGVTFESMRSQSGTDGWHHRKGYVSPKAVECFLHHPEEGQVGRLTNYF